MMDVIITSRMLRSGGERERSNYVVELWVCTNGTRVKWLWYVWQHIARWTTRLACSCCHSLPIMKIRITTLFSFYDTFGTVTCVPTAFSFRVVLKLQDVLLQYHH